MNKIIPIKIKPGLKLWQLDLAAKEISEIQPEKAGIGYVLTVVPGFIYCEALNYKNADKKFGKMIQRILSKKSTAPDQSAS